MVRPAIDSDVSWIAPMLRDFYQELYGEASADDLNTYISYVEEDFKNPKSFYIVDDERRGFFKMVKVEESILPGYSYWLGEKVYIKPEYRKTKLLSNFYNYMFEHFDGPIMGYTNINSQHIKVLDKRYECVAKVYKLRGERNG